MYNLKRKARQTVVYWGSPTNDGFGGKTFSTPIEIKVFWLSINEEFYDSKGVVQTSNAIFYPLQDVDNGSFVYLGSLGDLTTAQKNDPQTIPSKNVFVCKKIRKTPSIRGSRYIRRVWCTWSS